MRAIASQVNRLVSGVYQSPAPGRGCEYHTILLDSGDVLESNSLRKLKAEIKRRRLSSALIERATGYWVTRHQNLVHLYEYTPRYR